MGEYTNIGGLISLFLEGFFNAETIDADYPTA
jgi:hypothetical protein